MTRKMKGRWLNALWLFTIVPLASLLASIPGGINAFMLIFCVGVHFIGCRLMAGVIVNTWVEKENAHE